ncbi:uncharacterized protein LOC116224664 [Clupea harengus]|uniref:Uncharacterized protein LOC116224664 n=1 Tax=Clupea harengus TaxID=7950 RepID=A0A6P8GZU5_CLUHA|nr:uncharacterized protein LOC116224664 [Clupea harengus]
MDHKLNFSSATPVKSVATTWDYGYNIRHSIFLITGMCVGVPLVVWALGVLRQHQHNGGRVSVFITVLLLTDLLEMFLSPAMVVYLLLPDATCSGSVFLLFFGVKYCGLHLHQMVALEGVIARTYLPFTSLLFWRSFSILVCLLEGVFLLLCLCVYPFIQSAAVTFSWLLVALVPLGFTCKLAFTPTISPPDSDTVQEKDRTVLAIAVVSFFILYGPFLAFVFAQSLLPFSSEKYANGILVAMTVIHPVVCLRLIADPLLCVLVVRELPLDKATARISV